MGLDDQPNWLQAKGESDGNPIMVRARDPSQLSVDRTRSYVVVAVLGYVARDADQLPSDDDYERIEAFEADVFDTRSGDPELVFVETGSGIIRYFAYTSDVVRTLASISDKTGSFQILDLDSAEDPDWQIYHRRVERLHSG